MNIPVSFPLSGMGALVGAVWGLLSVPFVGDAFQPSPVGWVGYTAYFVLGGGSCGGAAGGLIGLSLDYLCSRFFNTAFRVTAPHCGLVGAAAGWFGSVGLLMAGLTALNDSWGFIGAGLVVIGFIIGVGLHFMYVSRHDRRNS